MELQVDHVHPSSLGGGDEEHNLVAACRDCNIGKRDHQVRTHPRARKETAVDIHGQQVTVWTTSDGGHYVMISFGPVDDRERTFVFELCDAERLADHLLDVSKRANPFKNRQGI